MVKRQNCSKRIQSRCGLCRGDPEAIISYLNKQVILNTIRASTECGTVEPRFTDTRLIRTRRYYGQFRWSQRKPHTFSLKLTRLIRTPVNADNGHFSVSRVTNSYILSTSLYGHYLSVHCEFSLSQSFVNLKTLDPGQIMTEFEEVKPFYYKEKLNSVTSGV